MDTRAEQVRLWRGLVLRAVSFLVVVIALVAFGRYRFETHAQELRVAERSAYETRRKVVELKHQAAFADSFGPRFRSMADGGAVGSFDKPRVLDRFEATLQPFSDQLERYALAGQSSFELDGAPALEQHALYRHRLSFELKPRHEEQFLKLLQAITAQTRGVAAIERCDIGRISDEASAALKAHCTINWYTFGDRIAAGAGSAAPVGAPVPGLGARAK
jgi:hypothetical protein